MSNDSNPDHPQICEDTIGISFVGSALVILPATMLDIAKKGIKDASHIEPTEKFALHELHALMMIWIDRERGEILSTRISRRGWKMPLRIYPKVTSASIQLIEAQETILKGPSRHCSPE